MEDPEQPHLRAPGGLDAVDLSSRQENAGAGPNRRARVACPHAARALENAEHLFVVMEVVGRAPRRNASHELRRLLATELLIDEDAVPAIPSGLRNAIAKPNDRIHRRVLGFLCHTPLVRADRAQARLPPLGPGRCGRCPSLMHATTHT